MSKTRAASHISHILILRKFIKVGRKEASAIATIRWQMKKKEQIKVEGMMYEEVQYEILYFLPQST